MSLFIVNDNKLDILKEYILMYDEFSVILNSFSYDEAIKIFKYIYEVSDNKSISNRQSYSKQKQKDHAKLLAKLDSDFVETSIIKTAIKKYKELNYNSNAEILSQLKANLQLSIEINNKIHKYLKAQLSNSELDDNKIPRIMEFQSKLFDVVEAIPNKIEKVKRLEAIVYDEITKKEIVGRGGEIIPDSYEGDPDIEGYTDS
jgi:hypothetical protein